MRPEDVALRPKDHVGAKCKTTGINQALQRHRQRLRPIRNQSHRMACRRCFGDEHIPFLARTALEGQRLDRTHAVESLDKVCGFGLLGHHYPAVRARNIWQENHHDHENDGGKCERHEREVPFEDEHHRDESEQWYGFQKCPE